MIPVKRATKTNPNKNPGLIVLKAICFPVNSLNWGSNVMTMYTEIMNEIKA